jgi:hypothetical protein
MDFETALLKFFGVVARGQTWLNLLYLLLAFPLGIFYFVFLVTGVSLGIGLAIIWVGVILLAGMFGAWYGLAAFERWMTMGMLRVNIPPMSRQDISGKTLWQQFTAAVGNPVTWKGLLYLLAKFPLGIFSFVMVTTLASVSLAFIAAPFYYQYFPPTVDLTFSGAPWANTWIVDSLSGAIVLCLLGILLGFVSLHIFNGLAWVSAQFARVMLGNYEPAAPASSAAVVPVTFITPPAPVEPAAATAEPVVNVVHEATPSPEEPGEPKI